MEEFIIQLQAILDGEKSKENINKDIEVLQKKLDALKLQATLDPKAAQSLADEIGKLINQKIVISNIGVDTNTLSKTGKQVGQVISDSAEKAINNVSSKSIGKYFKVNPSDSRQFQAEMEKLVSGWTDGKGKLTDIKIDTRTSFDKEVGENIERLHQATVTYKNELDEVIKKTIAWRQIGITTNAKGEEEILRGFVEVAGQYSKSIDTVNAKTDSFVERQKKAVTDLSNNLNKIYKGGIDQNSDKPIKNTENLSELKSRYDEIVSAIGRVGTASKSSFADEQNSVKTLISDLQILIREYKNAETVATSLRSKDISTVKSQYSSKLDNLITNMKSSGVYTNGFQKGADNLTSMLNSATDASGLTAFLNGLDKLDAGYKRAKVSAEAFNRSQKVGISVSGLQSKISDLQRISPEIDKFKTEINGADVTIQSLHDDLSKVSTQGDFSVVNAKWKAFTDAAKAAGIAVTEVGDKSITTAKQVNAMTDAAGLSVGGVLKNGLSKLLQMFGGYNIVAQFNKQLRNAWKEAQELDASITSLGKICDELADRSSFPAYIDRSISKAKELCTDVNDLLYAVTEFKKLGNTLENSEILAEYAIRLQNVGDTNIDTAISSIKTAMATFDEIGGYTDNEYENKVEAYIDLINNLSNCFSIDCESLANAVRISAGTLVEANTSIEEAASIITAANKYYDDPSYLANTIKIGALRLRASKTSDEAKELAELGENIDDLAESTSNLREEMLALTGVDIMIDDKNFKSYYQQLLDISKVYQSLDETTQANVLEKMFGKNRSAAGANILKAMSDSVEVYNEALQSAGSSQEEFSRWTGSAEAATKRFGVALTETYNNIISGDTVKGLANVGTALLDLANKLGLVEKGFKGFLIIGAMKGITTLSVAIKNSAVQLSNYGKALDAVKKVSTCAQDTQTYANAMDTLKSSCVNLTDAQLKQVLANRNLEKSQLIEILQLKDLNAEEKEARLAQLGLIKTTKEQTTVNGKASVSTFSLKASMKGLKTSIMEAWAAMSALQKASIVFAAISTVWSFISLAMDANNQKAEEARQKAAELTEAYKQQQSSLDSQIKKYKELKESLDKGNLSVDEARSIKEQLLEIQNSLVESYGTEVSNLDLVNGKYREQLGLLNDLSKEKARDYVTEHESDYQTAKKELEKVRKYRLGSIIPGIDDAKNELVDYLKTYSELLNVERTAPGEVSISVKANAEEADKLMHQLARDLQDWADENDIDREIIKPLQIGISKYAGKTMTDALKEHKTLYDEFIKAKILSDDTLRTLYQQSIQAVEAYNKALSSNEGVEAAKANLDSVQQSVQNATTTLEGSQGIFDNIYEAVNKNAEAAYQLNQAFKNDETVKGYAEQLRGLSDIDLKAINFEDSVQSPGEEAFGALIDILGLSEDEVQKLIDKLVELGYVQGKVQDAPPKTPATFDITTYKDQIDDFQSKLKSLGDALSSIRSSNFEDSDLTDLLQEFPELADKTDDLENAIVILINNALQALYDTLGENIPDSLKTSLQELADIASGTAKHLGDALSSIHDSWDILHDFKDTMDKGFDTNVTDSLLQSVRKLSGELETLVAGYYSGVVTAEQLYEALEEHYDNDLRNYSEALIKKNDLNEDFYNAVGLASEKVTNQFMNDYDVALKNCKNYNQAKLEIEQQTLGKIGSMWSKYYDIASQTYTQEMLNLREQEKSMPDDNAFVLIDGEVKTKKQMLQEQILEIESQVDNYKSAMEALNNITYDGIRSNFEGIGSKLSSSSSSEKDTTKEFDWIEQAIENVEKEVKELDEVVNSSYSTFSQKNEALAKEIGKVSEEIELQQKAYEEYMWKADSIGLSDDYKNLIRDGAINIENITDEDLQKKISDYQQWYEKAIDVSEAISDLNEQMKDLHVEGYELQAERLEDLLDSNSITEKQYLTEMKKLYKEYYEDQVEYAQKAHEAKMALLEKEKSYLNSVANAASSLLDKEIDTIRDNAESQEEALNKQIDAHNAQIDLLNEKKKLLQDELDALEDKARDENLILDLQQKQYNLAKAESQRSKLLYKDGQLIWNNDPTAIRDAKKDVDNAKLAIQKNDIQKQIDALDDEIDRYNDLIDLVNDQIDQINEAADAQIDALEKIKNKWQEVIDQQEYAKNLSLLIGEFGTDAITKILTGNDDDLLAQWKENYINTLADIDMESQGYIGDMIRKIAGLYNVDLSPLQNQFQNVKESVDGVGVAADESLPNVISYMDDIGTAAMIATSAISSVIDAINSIPEEKDVTINVHTSGIGGSSNKMDLVGNADFTGRAYADGNEGLEHDEKNALRSEYGQPEVTVYPDGTTELTTQPIMSDLPKGTVIYNEEQTKKIMNAKPQAVGNAHADGTNEGGWWIGSDGHRYRDLQPGDQGYDMMKAFEPLLNKWLNGEMEIISNAVFEGQKQMERLTKEITNNTAISNIVNNNRNIQQPVVNQNVTINCPNVTNDSGVEHLQQQLGHLSLMATQVPLRDY